MASYSLASIIKTEVSGEKGKSGRKRERGQRGGVVGGDWDEDEGEERKKEGEMEEIGAGGGEKERGGEEEQEALILAGNMTLANDLPSLSDN